MGILERESQLKLANTTIRLGERFCFELESEEEGFVIALQGVRGQWHNIPLGPNGEASAPIQSGQNRLPKTQDGKLDPLVEQHDEGVHTFVLIFSEAPDIPSNIAQLGAWRKASCIVHSATVKFIS